MNKIFHIILILMFIFACDRIERFDNEFGNYAELIDSQSWKGGWIPKTIPQDAFNIKESHYIDRTSVILAFDFSVNYKNILDETCSEIASSEIHFANINADWWPNSLTGEAFASSHEYYYYSCKDIDGYFAISFNSKRAYYWRL